MIKWERLITCLALSSILYTKQNEMDWYSSPLQNELDIWNYIFVNYPIFLKKGLVRTVVFFIAPIGQLLHLFEAQSVVIWFKIVIPDGRKLCYYFLFKPLLIRIINITDRKLLGTVYSDKTGNFLIILYHSASFSLVALPLFGSMAERPRQHMIIVIFS